MAITLVDTSGTGSSTTFNHDVGTAGTKRLVIMWSGADNESPKPTDLTAVTVDSKSMTRVINLDHAFGENMTELWVIDEADLGASTGSVQISVTGSNGHHTFHAFTFSGVDQTDVYTPYDEATTLGTNSKFKHLDDASTPANGLVTAFYNLADPRTESSITSPLIGNSLPVRSGNGAFSHYGIETTAQVNKTYTLELTSGQNRSAHAGASWAEAPPTPIGVKAILLWNRDVL